MIWYVGIIMAFRSFLSVIVTTRYLLGTYYGSIQNISCFQMMPVIPFFLQVRVGFSPNSLCQAARKPLNLPCLSADAGTSGLQTRCYAIGFTRAIAFVMS